jgi:protein gp37
MISVLNQKTRWIVVDVSANNENLAKARPMKEHWVDSVHQQCDEQGVAFFFKQWGTWGADGARRSKQANGRSLNGQTWDAMPKLELRA